MAGTVVIFVRDRVQGEAQGTPERVAGTGVAGISTSAYSTKTRGSRGRRGSGEMRGEGGVKWKKKGERGRRGSGKMRG